MSLNAGVDPQMGGFSEDDPLSSILKGKPHTAAELEVFLAENPFKSTLSNICLARGAERQRQLIKKLGAGEAMQGLEDLRTRLMGYCDLIALEGDLSQSLRSGWFGLTLACDWMCRAGMTEVLRTVYSAGQRLAREKASTGSTAAGELGSEQTECRFQSLIDQAVIIALSASEEQDSNRAAALADTARGYFEFFRQERRNMPPFLQAYYRWIELSTAQVLPEKEGGTGPGIEMLREDMAELFTFIEQSRLEGEDARLMKQLVGLDLAAMRLEGMLHGPDQQDRQEVQGWAECLDSVLKDCGAVLDFDSGDGLDLSLSYTEVQFRLTLAEFRLYLGDFEGVRTEMKALREFVDEYKLQSDMEPEVDDDCTGPDAPELRSHYLPTLPLEDEDMLSLRAGIIEALLQALDGVPVHDVQESIEAAVVGDAPLREDLSPMDDRTRFEMMEEALSRLNMLGWGCCARGDALNLEKLRPLADRLKGDFLELLPGENWAWGY